jgi:hypothetical protein
LHNSMISFTDEFIVLLQYKRVAAHAFLENIWWPWVHSGGLCIIGPSGKLYVTRVTK